MSQSIVNSWNEWDPLEEIIVGIPDLACIPADEPAFRAKMDKATVNQYIPGLKTKESIEKATRQLDNFVNILKNHQVTIRRPDSIDFTKEVKTNDFSVPCQYDTSNPRDVLITIGNQIYEAPMSWRSRFFEYTAYKTILKDYMRQDSNFKWVIGPKPTMKDELYNLNYPWKYDENRIEYIKNYNYVTTEFEPIFDAADITRFGKDIMIQHSFTTNLMGIDWFKRSLGPEYRVHTLHFPNDLTPFHMDATFVPIKPPADGRPGIILSSPDRALANNEKHIFDGSWDILSAPIPDHETSTPLSLCSKWLSINCLMINPDTIIMEESEKKTIKFVEDQGIKVIPCAFRDVYEFGGSFHCTTCDVRRRGDKQSYFPNLDKLDNLTI